MSRLRSSSVRVTLGCVERGVRAVTMTWQIDDDPNWLRLRPPAESARQRVARGLQTAAAVFVGCVVFSLPDFLRDVTESGFGVAPRLLVYAGIGALVGTALVVASSGRAHHWAFDRRRRLLHVYDTLDGERVASIPAADITAVEVRRDVLGRARVVMVLQDGTDYALGPRSRDVDTLDSVGEALRDALRGG